MMIVVAVILVLAAMAAFSLTRAKMSANEASAVESLRVINTAELTYQIVYPSRGPVSLSVLGGGGAGCSAAGPVNESQACLIESLLSNGRKSGYVFQLTVGDEAAASSYAVTAMPVSPGFTGRSNFCSDQTGVIRFEINPTQCTNQSRSVGGGGAANGGDSGDGGHDGSNGGEGGNAAGGSSGEGSSGDGGDGSGKDH